MNNSRIVGVCALGELSVTTVFGHCTASFSKRTRDGRSSVHPAHPRVDTISAACSNEQFLISADSHSVQQCRGCSVCTAPRDISLLSRPSVNKESSDRKIVQEQHIKIGRALPLQLHTDRSLSEAQLDQRDQYRVSGELQELSALHRADRYKSCMQVLEGITEQSEAGWTCRTARRETKLRETEYNSSRLILILDFNRGAI
ncbi:hypothetical protein MHYP_G00040530 [Metynnis hypsauchen]